MIVAIALGGMVAGGCGSSTTPTASIAQTKPTTSTPRPSRTAQDTAPSSNASARTATPRVERPPAATGPRRSAPAPAFTQQAESSEGLSSALSILTAHGFAAADTSTYHPRQTLRVLIGTRSGTGGGRAQQAFFFEDERYLGTDASEPSAAIKVVSQGDTEVRLAYALYRPGDPVCCPNGGEATVRFQLDNGHLQALDPIPPVGSAAATGRQ